MNVTMNAFVFWTLLIVAYLVGVFAHWIGHRDELRAAWAENDALFESLHRARVLVKQLMEPAPGNWVGNFNMRNLHRRARRFLSHG